MQPPGATCEGHRLEPGAGGSYRITMFGETGDRSENSHPYSRTFEELAPGERIVGPSRRGRHGRRDDGYDDGANGTEVTVRLETPAAWPDGSVGGWEDGRGSLAQRLTEDG